MTIGVGETKPLQTPGFREISQGQSRRAPRRLVARKGAYFGLAGGFFTFLILHTPMLDPGWLGQGSLHDVVGWLHAEGPNPFSCGRWESSFPLR